MDKRTLTMNWDRVGDDEDDHFFETYDRISSAVPLDLDSSDEEFDDSRMSFASAVSSAAVLNDLRNCSFKSSTNPPSVLENYDVWMAEPGSIQDRRKRLFQGMGLNSNKELLAIASTKFSRGVSKKVQTEKQGGNDKPKTKESKKEPTTKPEAEKKNANGNDPESLPPSTIESLPTTTMESLPPATIVLVRSRSDGEIVSLSFLTRRRKEELLGKVSKQRLTRTSSAIMRPNVGVCQVANTIRFQSSKSSVNSTDQLGSYFLIKNLDTGTEFIVKEYNDKGLWNKVSDLHTGKQLTLEEFEKSVGHSPVVKELMHRTSLAKNPDDDKKAAAAAAADSSFTKSFRNSKKKGAALFKNIMGVANSVSGFIGEREKSQQQSQPEQKSNKNSSSQWVKVRQHGKQYKEYTGLHLCQEIQAHEGSIWTIKFSHDACFLASAGEDRVIHVWEVQECEVVSSKPPDDMNSASSTPVHPMAMAGSSPDRPPLAENNAVPSEKKTKGKNSSKKKGNSIPDYVNVPETVFALSERPICSFTGHQDDVLDLSWSKSQLLLSSSMDKTVRLWDIETKDCLKMFAHNDYVTCIQFNPVDDDYFLSGSLDAKIRIWSIPNRQVVDWMDLHEMVTAACYTPDGQSAVVGSHKGTCRLYSTADSKLEQKENINIQTKKKAQPKKITGFQYNPSNPSELLITSADSRIRIFDGSDITHKFRGFRNTSSQIASSFSPDGKYVISASEDSQVYVWKREESRNAGNGKSKTIISIPSHEHFNSKEVSVAIPWPGSIKNEPPIVELHSKRHSRRTTPQSQSGNVSPTKEEVGPNSKAQLPPLPHKNNHSEKVTQSEKVTSSPEEDQDQISRTESGIGESFSSASMRDDPSAISNSSSSLGSWSSSWSWFDVGNSHTQTVQATAWGLVIVTAGLGGEIRAYQNFGLPLKVGRQTYLFRDLT
ncbi:hypothetical protein AgCh_021101 [Apium graveolens]